MGMLPPAGSFDDELMSKFDARRNDERTLFVLGRPVPIAKSVVRPPVTWDAVVPGLVFPALEYLITPEAVEWYYRAIVAPFGETVPARPAFAPPLFFGDEPMQCVNTIFSRSGRLHAGLLVEAYRTVPVRSLVRSVATVAARYEASGKQFYEVNCITSIAGTGDEEPAVRTRATFVI
jgi:hypothetical protein